MDRLTSGLSRRKFTEVAGLAVGGGLGLAATTGVGRAQTVRWHWYRRFGSLSYFADDIAPTLDGGYVVLVESIDFFGNRSRVLLVKLDSTGRMEWIRRYGPADREDSGAAVVALTSGGYAIAATANVASDDSAVWLILTDDQGKVRRSRTFTDSDEGGEYAADLVETRRDGETAGLGVLGTSTAPSGDGNVRLRRVNTRLAPTWERTYERDGDESAVALIRPENGGYVYAATAGDLDPRGTNDYVLGRTAGNGAPRWVRTYGGTGRAAGIAEVVDDGETSGYAVVGTVSRRGADDIRVVTTDGLGKRERARTFDRNGTGDAAADIAFVGDGFAIFGRTDTPGEEWDGDYWLLRTDARLDRQWGATYDLSTLVEGRRTGSAEYAAAFVTDGEEYTLAGSSLSSGDADASVPWVVHVVGRT